MPNLIGTGGEMLESSKVESRVHSWLNLSFVERFCQFIPESGCSIHGCCYPSQRWRHPPGKMYFLIKSELRLYSNRSSGIIMNCGDLNMHTHHQNRCTSTLCCSDSDLSCCSDKVMPVYLHPVDNSESEASPTTSNLKNFMLATNSCLEIWEGKL